MERSRLRHVSAWREAFNQGSVPCLIAIFLHTGMIEKRRSSTREEVWYDSQMEMTYAGPDTDEVRTVIGSQPYADKCDPRACMTELLAEERCGRLGRWQRRWWCGSQGKGGSGEKK